MKTLPNTIDLDYLCVFPGYFDAEQNQRAVEQLHALIRAGFSLSDIAQIAHEHSIEQHARLLVFNPSVLSGENAEHFSQLVSLRLYEMLLYPEAACDFLEVVCRERVLLSTQSFNMAMRDHPHDFSFGRDANKQVFPSKKLGFVSQSKTIIEHFLLSFIRSDDIEGLKVYLTLSRVNNHYPAERASDWVREFRPQPGSAIADHFLKEKKGSIIPTCVQYVADLKKVANAVMPQSEFVFEPELTRKVGHELIREFMNNVRVQAQTLLKELIRQGADWHLAVQIHLFGQAAYYDYVNRPVDLESEVLHLIKNRRAIPAPFAPLLFETLGEEFMIKLAKDHNLADTLWKTWKLGYLIEQVSKKHQAEILEKDLGL